jgi:hypothetical protein
MMTHLIDIIAGAQPNFMKIALITRVLQLRQATGGSLRYRPIYIGQHFDARRNQLQGDGHYYKLFFTTRGVANQNLWRSGVPMSRYFSSAMP